jgi:MoaA/NifB/PqqE/SkfB family radical SAM enzyme
MPSAKDVSLRALTRLTNRIYTLPVVILMPHSQCNCRCVMCDIWKANHDRRQLTPEDLAGHLETFRSLRVQRVVLSGGEALLHQNLWTLCEQLKQRPVKITLLSTGLLVRLHALSIARWIDDVVVSLDGSPTVHDQIRRIPRAFERLAEGVRELKRLRPDLPIRARCVVQRRNFFDLRNIVETAHWLGLDQISFLAADVSSEAFNRNPPWDAERIDDVALSSAETAQFEDVLEDVIRDDADLIASGFIAESADKLRRLAQYYRALNRQGEFPTTVCNAPWVSAVVEADGTVRPCFFHRGLGNVHEQSLGDVLNSAKAIDFRRNLDVRRDPICRKCVCTLQVGLRANAP